MLLGWHLCTNVYKLTLNVTVWFNVPLNTLEVIWETIFSTNHLAAVKTQCSQHWRIHSQSLSTTCWVWTVNIWRRSMRQSSQKGLQAETPLQLNAFLHYHNLRSQPIFLNFRGRIYALFFQHNLSTLTSPSIAWIEASVSSVLKAL